MSSICNIPKAAMDKQWMQASLPVCYGGLGLCSVVQLAPRQQSRHQLLFLRSRGTHLWSKLLLIISLRTHQMRDQKHGYWQYMYSKELGAWLNTLPLSQCGLRMDDETVHLAVGLRLGAPLCYPHQCCHWHMVECSSSVAVWSSNG